MRSVTRLLILVVGLGVLASVGAAQSPKDQPSGTPKGGPTNASAVDAIVARMMAFDTNKDGKLTRDEITDERLLRLFDRADANKDGVVTREELVALFEREGRSAGGGRGFDGPPDRAGPPRPGQVLPDFLQDQVQLTDAQKKQIADLQKEVDARLEKILTPVQKARPREI